MNARATRTSCARAVPAAKQRNVAARAAGAMPGPVPDQNKRNIVNLMLVGATGLPTVGLAIPYLSFFVPPKVGGEGGGMPAADKQGKIVMNSKYLETHPKGDVNLVQGLKGDPTYIVVKEDAAELRNFGLNAVCTHLGCVVPWNGPEKKFKCPCHGSQYNTEGKVIRGPAPLSLALCHVDVVDDVVTLTPWEKSEKDFRTNTDPWWA